MNIKLLAVASATFIAFAASANATVYDFSFSGLNVSGSGVITTADAGSPSAVTGATGTITDTDIAGGPFTITGLSSYAGADNTLYPAAAPFVDLGGVSFTTTGGDFNLGLGGPDGPFGLILNVAVLNPGGYAVGDPGSVPITLSVAAVPEPAAWALMLIGFGGLGVGLRSRRRIASAA